MKYCENLGALIGNTPLFRLKNYEKKENLNCEILAKLEFFNPAGSIKDRVAFAMIEAAEKEGKIKEGSTIIEPTSGNTGIGLAAICAAKKYRLILTMPETMSRERRNLLKSYGAEIVLTKGEKAMAGAIEKANELLVEIENSFMPDQFSNPVNPKIHKTTTGPEIFRDTEGKIDILIATVGTGGTISGIGSYIKSRKKDVKIVAVEPTGSPAISQGKSGPHKIQGIGAGFVPENLYKDVYDEVVTIKDEEAFKTANLIAKEEGILVGISSGAAVFAANLIAKKKENYGKLIVVILPDGGEKYLSTNLFSN